MTGEQQFEIGGDAAQQLVARVLRGKPPLDRPEPIVLAAWLEGRLSEAEAAKVEAWIADTPEAVEEVALLREAVETDDLECPAAPAAFVSRAQAIVRAPVDVRPESGSWTGSNWIERLIGQPVVRWSAVAALALIVGVGGFGIGTEGLAPSLSSLDSTQVTVADFGAQPAPFL